MIAIYLVECAFASDDKVHSQPSWRKRIANGIAVQAIYAEEQMMSGLNIQQMLNGLCRAAEERDGEAFASHFAEDGVYHDDFYGSFAGRERVAELINDWFHKDARDLRWDMVDPALEAGRLYVRYIFSYNSTLPEAEGARTMFDGVAIMSLRDGKIADYREVINCGTAFVDMKFHPERIFKIFSRKAFAMKARPEVQRHLPSA